MNSEERLKESENLELKKPLKRSENWSEKWSEINENKREILILIHEIPSLQVKLEKISEWKYSLNSKRKEAKAERKKIPKLNRK